jgi:hypothetical protein
MNLVYFEFPTIGSFHNFNKTVGTAVPEERDNRNSSSLQWMLFK